MVAATAAMAFWLAHSHGCCCAGHRVRLFWNLRHYRELAQRQGPTVRTRTGFLGLHRRRLPGPGGRTAHDRPRSIATATPFNIIVSLFAVALFMVSTTKAEPPRTNRATPLPFGPLSRAAPVAVVGCAVGGLVSSTFYALVPAWMQGEGIPRATIALFMLVAVLGGLAFQVPVGWISDRFDRRIVLAALGLGFAGTAVALILLPRSLPMVLTTAALLGGFMSTIYPVCVAVAHDRMPADRVLAVSGRLILVSGLGSVIGPLVGTSLMRRFDIDGVFYFMAAASILLALLAAGERMITAPALRLPRPFQVLTPQAASLAHDPLGFSDEPTLPDPIGIASNER